MPPVVVAHVDEPDAWTSATQQFAAWNRGYLLGQGTLTRGDETMLRPAHGGVRYCWLFAGDGEVWLPAGFRTQEGDGSPMPSDYLPDPLPREAVDALATVADALATGVPVPAVQAPVEALLARWQRQPTRFVGDIAGEVWRLLESGIPPQAWLPGAAGDALRWLAAQAPTLGWSTKQMASWEPITAGDQLVVTAERPARVRGPVRYWWIEDLQRDRTPTPTARRLRYLQDTAGGCAPGFDAFRRLPLTWAAAPESIHHEGASAADAAGPAGGNQDSQNRTNCHVLNIAAELSRTHYHPQAVIGGGQAQFEIYFAVDPSGWKLGTAGRPGRLYTFPDIGRWSTCETTALLPGTIALIPPDTGHRGCDAFVQIVTVPGFKPGNELYLDRLIRDATDGTAPHNAALAAAETLADDPV